MIKLIALDLDGTLLTTEKKLTNHTKEVLEQALSQGIHVVPATGRPFCGIPKEILALDGIRYIIAANGSSVYDLKEQKLLHEACMDKESVLDMVKEMKSVSVAPEVFIDGFGYCEEQTLKRNITYAANDGIREYFKTTRKPVKNLVDFLETTTGKIQKVAVIFRPLADGTLEGKKEVLELLQKYDSITAVSGIPINIEVTSKEATKGNGIRFLASYLGISIDEVMACGDSGNDKEMLLAAGMGVAMGNATDEVKEVADYITKSNEEDGAAFAIEKFAL